MKDEISTVSETVSIFKPKIAIDRWLTSISKSGLPYNKFSLHCFEEIQSPNQDIIQLIAWCSIQALCEYEYLVDLAKRNEISYLEEVLNDTEPSEDIVKSGDFGEILSCIILEGFLGYTIPVKKLRYKFTPNATQTGTDIIALKIEDGSIKQVCYVEAKYRDKYHTSSAIDAHEQLCEKYRLRINSVCVFIERRLYLDGSPLHNEFHRYMRNRSSMKSNELFMVSLIHETLSWNKGVLQKLEAEIDTDGVPDTSVLVVRLKDLRKTRDQSYDAIGLGVVIDDE